MGDILKFEIPKTSNDYSIEELVDHVKNTANIAEFKCGGMKLRIWPALDGSYKVHLHDKDLNGSFNTFTTLESAMAVFEELKARIEKGERDWRVLNAVMVNMSHS